MMGSLQFVPGEKPVPAGNYKKLDSWECQLPECGMIIVSREAHDKWHAYRDENKLAPLAKEAHEKGGERTVNVRGATVRLRSDGEWPR